MQRYHFNTEADKGGMFLYSLLLHPVSIKEKETVIEVIDANTSLVFYLLSGTSKNYAEFRNGK